MEPIFVQQRSTPFNARFPQGEATAITTMNAAGDDIASQSPRNPIDIQKVGLVRTNIPVTINNPFSLENSFGPDGKATGTGSQGPNSPTPGGNNKVTVYADVKVSTYVPAAVRGVHMSRMNTTFANASLGKYNTIFDYAKSLAHGINSCHFGGRTTVSVTATLPVFAHVKGWKSEKDKVSLDHIGLRTEVSYSSPVNGGPGTPGNGSDQGAECKVRGGIQINHITACPCVQKTFAHAANLHDVPFPLMTHSQRTTTWIDISDLQGPVGVPKLLAAVDAVVHRVHNTLPREYELAKVHDAHTRPQFAEDVVRDIAISVRAAYASDPNVGRDGKVTVHAVSAESIHDFDIVAEIEFPIHA